ALGLALVSALMRSSTHSQENRSSSSPVYLPVLATMISFPSSERREDLTSLILIAICCCSCPTQTPRVALRTIPESHNPSMRHGRVAFAGFVNSSREMAEVGKPPHDPVCAVALWPLGAYDLNTEGTDRRTQRP